MGLIDRIKVYFIKRAILKVLKENPMFKNWKTNSAALGIFIMAAYTAIRALTDGDPGTNPDWALLITELLAVFGLGMAKDHNVTGGNTPQ